MGVLLGYALLLLLAVGGAWGGFAAASRAFEAESNWAFARGLAFLGFGLLSCLFVLLLLLIILGS